MIGAPFLALAVFITIMVIYLIITTIQKSKKTMTEKLLEKKFEEDRKEDELLHPSDNQVEKKGLIGKLEKELLEAQIKMDVRVFILIIFVLTILFFIGAFYIFGQPLVALAPLPFTLCFIPKTFIDYKKEKNMDRFESELIQILRRMSSVLKNGSVLQALEDVKDLHSLSEKSRILLNEIYHRYKYGDSIESAFRKVAEKSGSEQFKLCAISIDINKELGADLSQSINEVALSIQRIRLTQKESKSLIAQSVMIGRVLSIIPFFILGFMIMQNRDYFSSYLETIGHQFIFMLLFMMMFFGIYIVDKVAKAK